MAADDHYLKNELYALVQRDGSVLDFLMRGSLDGVWYWDLESPEDEWLSPQFWEILGYDPAEREHKAAEWQDIIHPEDLQTALDNFNKHVADPNHPYDQLVRYTHKQGHTVWVRCRGMAIRDAAGKPVRMLGAHTEMTALKQAEETLAQQNQALAAINRELEEKGEALMQANSELEEFAFVAAHDLKEPLRKIQLFGTMLEKQAQAELSDRNQTTLRTMIESGERLALLIERLLEYSRLGKAQRPATDLPLQKVVDRVLQNISSLIERQQATISVRGTLPIIHGDDFLLDQLLQNLIGNAVKFAKPNIHPEVSIEQVEPEDLADHLIGLDTAKEFVCVAVRDNGIGFDPKYAESIFNIFERLHARHEYAGTGIGLSICRKAADKLGGAIWARSELGKGATFYVALPAGGEV